MIEKNPDLFDEMYNFFVKILIPSLVAISIKTAIQVKKEKLTFTRVVMSFVMGVGCAYFVYPFIDKQIDNSYIPLLVGVVSISGEKIAEYLIYKFNVDSVLGAIVDALIDKFRSGKK